MTDHPAVAVDRVVAAGAALAAARDTGVLERLADGPVDLPTLADDLGLDERLLGRTLDALVALGIVQARPRGRFLVAGTVPAAVGAAARYDGLASALQGESRNAGVEHAAGAARLYPGLVGALGEAFTPAASEVAGRLARPGIRVLDVGAGAAPWSLAIARAEPAVQVVALDLPAVAPATRRAVREAGMADRVRVVAGDVFDASTLDVDGPFDLVLLANVCHLFAPDRVAALLAEVAAAYVAPDGRLAIVDVLPDGVRDEPGLALYALGLAMRTATGGLHAEDDYVCWLRAAGLGHVQRCRTTAGMAVLVADRGRSRPGR